jgi:carboxymethylenebutenolidase
MGKMVSLTAKDGFKLEGYVAEPAGKPKGGLVIIQEIFGVNNHMRKVTDGFAKDGYLAIAPALFDRVGKDIQLGYAGADMDKAKESRAKLKWDEVLADTAAAQDYVKGAGKVGIVGYCFGGSVAWLGATRMNFACSVSYYGGNVADFANEKPKCPVICHIGSEDAGINADKVAIIKKAQPDVPVYIYQGAGHGFNCDERGSWNAEAAKLARERTIDFLKKHIG